MDIFGFLAVPLGWLMGIIYNFVNNYFLAIFLFTLLVRVLMFPLSLKSQKSQADRARLAPRLERLQKKYAKDPRKLQEKQQALYEKEGVSLTGGCMPMVVQMVVLFGIISVIYSPLKHLVNVPTEVIDASYTALADKGVISAEQSKSTYYKEMYMLRGLEGNEADVKAAIMKAGNGYTEVQAQGYITTMAEVKEQFTFFGRSLLENPWNPDKGFGDISILWLIPLISGLTAVLTSWISMQYNKQLTPQGMQQGAGCMNFMMLGWMPLFSLFIAFTVPGGVGIYWICSNVVALLQTVVLNAIYNPAKIRAQAEIEYEERRKQKEADKKRLAEARAKEQRELAAQLNEEKGDAKKGTKKPKTEQPKAEEPAEETVAPSPAETPATEAEPDTDTE